MFSVLNSLVIVLFLSGMVAMILLRTLHKDIARYNQIDSGEDAQEEFGWKLVHGDVFRPPRKGMLLSVFLGSGTQLLSMAAITLVFACLGFLSPANRGALMTCALVLFVCLGTPAGYVAARIYKSFGGEKWKSNVLLTSMLSWGGLRPLLHLEPGALVLRLLGRHPLLHPGGAARPLVRRVRPAHLRRSLLRLQEVSNRAACEDQPDSETDSRPVCLHPANPWDHHGRRAPLWLHLHPALLRAEQHLEQPDLLHVRLPLPRVHHPDHHLLRDHNSPLLLPPMCGGLSLVVAQFSDFGLHSLLSCSLLYPLLHHKAGHCG